jgi:phage tail protein X
MRGVSNPYKTDQTDIGDLIFRGVGCIAFIMIVLMNIEPDEELLVQGQKKTVDHHEGRALVDVDQMGGTGGFGEKPFNTDDDDEQEGLSDKLNLKACIRAMESTCQDSDGMKCVDCVSKNWTPLKEACAAKKREDVDALCWRNYQVDFATLADVVKVQPCIEAIQHDCKGHRGMQCIDCIQASWETIANECDAFQDADAENFVQALCFKHPSRTLSLQDREIKAARDGMQRDEELLGETTRKKREAVSLKAMEVATAIESEWAAP